MALNLPAQMYPALAWLIESGSFKFTGHRIHDLFTIPEI